MTGVSRPTRPIAAVGFADWLADGAHPGVPRSVPTFSCVRGHPTHIRIVAFWEFKIIDIVRSWLQRGDSPQTRHVFPSSRGKIPGSSMLQFNVFPSSFDLRFILCRLHAGASGTDTCGICYLCAQRCNMPFFRRFQIVTDYRSGHLTATMKKWLLLELSGVAEVSL
jgi:hypothetical protein